jgi:hypothetical protein
LSVWNLRDLPRPGRLGSDGFHSRNEWLQWLAFKISFEPG